MEKKEIVIATSNQNKLAEFRRMLEPLGFQVDSLKEFNISMDVEETGKTFKENSLLKARWVKNKLPQKIIIADDSGLEVHALNNFPGIYSARFMEGSPYSLKCQEIIKRLQGQKDRSANFISAISVVNYDKEDHVFIGKTFGKITSEYKSGNGFGYDPIFFSDELNKTFGEASGEEKDSVSHRGKALRQLCDFLKSIQN